MYGSCEVKNAGKTIIKFYALFNRIAGGQLKNEKIDQMSARKEVQ